jgi:DNA-directed RNA polymerase II subunit RPB1
MSVAEVKYEKAYEGGMPKDEGIVDRRLGANGPSFPCITCHGDDKSCPGHFGHIELAKPMFNIGFISTTLKTLRNVCHYCSKILCNQEHVKIALSKKSPAARMRYIMKACGGSKRSCSGDDGCGNLQPTYTRDGFRIRAVFEDSDKDTVERKQTITAERAYAIFKVISDEHAEAMGMSARWSRPEWFILTLLPVPPPPVRPSVMQGSMRAEDDLTNKLGDIVKNNNALRNLEGTGAPAHALREQLDLVQYHIATYMNNELPGIMPATVRGSGRALKSIGQRFKGKEGRVRGNLMGKRVDFSARTVITPDPNLQLYEVGVPYSIARNLTYPEVVTPYNKDQLMELVENGPDEYPGAKYIERDDGYRVNLAFVQNRSDIQLEYGYKVVRHIRNGDYVLFNRQPSLHKMSIMGHRIRIMHFSTFRLNLSVTSPYNADFDGDEMNLHVPQTEMTRAEVMELMLVPKCIVSPQGNKPVMGIVQDTLLGCMLFTYRDTFLERDLMMNMLLHVTGWNGVIPEPAIYKPKPLWTGKQIFSLILPEVNMVRTNITHPDSESTDISPGDTKVYISRGELIHGIVDKKTVGSSANGLIHITWKEFGPDRTSRLISDIQVLVNHYVLQRGQSIGIGDTIADKATMTNVFKTIQGAKDDVKELIQQLQDGELELLPGKSLMQSFETEVNKKLNGARDQSGSSAQKSLLVSNNLKRMVSAGSKGSFINISQICACVGQQNVEGARIAYGFRRRTLPHFVMDDKGPESRGFVENSYLRGLTPSEFFFHAMGGREGLIDTAVKTAETGYIQRRLIKAMEDVMVHYDGTVRNSVGHIVEFLYGEDAMDGTRVEDQVLRTLRMGNAKLRREYYLDPTDTKFGVDPQGQAYLASDIVDAVRGDASVHQALQDEYEEILRDRDVLREVAINGEAKRPLPVNLDRLIWNAKQNEKITAQSVSDLSPEKILKLVKLLLGRTKVFDVADGGNEEDGLDPIDDEKPNVGDAISREAQDNATLLFSIHIRATLACKKLICEHRLSHRAFMWLLNEIEQQFKACRCPPGEMIGALAAQSIGEPATQMTLNTFHYAGVSAKNVTLGVPRLKEIINVSKNPKTPSLTIFLKPEFSADQEMAKGVASELQHTTLRDVMQASEVYYDPDVRGTVVEADQELVEEYFEAELSDELPPLSPWLLRIELDPSILEDRNITMDNVQRKLEESFGKDVHIIRSEENYSSKVIRLRIVREPTEKNDPAEDLDGRVELEDEEDSDDLFLRRIEAEILAHMTLGGMTSIRKVFMRQTKTSSVEPGSGEYKSGEEWVLDTDGVNLLGCMSHPSVDHTRTSSNDVCEIFEVLGIEAARAALLNEIRGVISFDGAYVNHRHLAILVDCMTYRGHLMSITRSGINRVDTGPLMQCSFEETTDILLAASMAGLKDPLTGVSENIMLGQIAPIGTGSFSLLLNETMLKDVMEPAEEDVDMAMARPLRSPATNGIGSALGGGMDRPGSTWTPRNTPGRRFDVRATPSMAYSPAAWQGTPTRMGSVRGGVSPFASRMSPTDEDAQFSPTNTPGNATGLRRTGSAYAHNSAYTPLQSPWAASPGGGGASPYASSPRYGGVSPAGGAGVRSIELGGSFASPSSSGYRATSPGPNYGAGPSPGFAGGSSYSPTSPAYQASPGAASPAFQVASPRVGGGASYSPSSPAFSPGAASPQYSPSSPRMPLTSPYHPGGASPQYQAASPAYRYGKGDAGCSQPSRYLVCDSHSLTVPIS